VTGVQTCALPISNRAILGLKLKPGVVAADTARGTMPTEYAEMAAIPTIAPRFQMDRRVMPVPPCSFASVHRRRDPAAGRLLVQEV
jgi:hypothetical protein